MPDNYSRNLSQERFGKFAAGYVTSPTHAKGAELDRLLEIAQPEPGWITLDVATGGGHTALKFAPHVAEVIAADITPAMLEAANDFVNEASIGNITFVLADAEYLPFRNSIFDLVTCRVAAHHFPNVARFVKESARVLKDRGLLLVQDHVLPDDEHAGQYIDDFERLRDPSHHRAHSETLWKAMFIAANLQIEHSQQFLRQHKFGSWAALQECTPEITEQLQDRVARAPQAVLDWMQPQRTGGSVATFVNHHIIITGRKPPAR